MIILPPPTYRPSQKRGPRAKAPPALVMILASYAPSAWVHVKFDRHVDISAIDVSVFFVDDNVSTDERFQGTGTAILLTPQIVQVPLISIGGASGRSLTTLTAGPNSGIVAIGDGGTWEGVNDVALPFP